MSRPAPTYRSLWQIAWPVMAASFSQNFASVIDTFFLARVGKEALAAGAIGVILFLTLGFIGLGLGTGVQVLTAHLLGENRPHHLGDLFRQGLKSGLLIGLFLTITTFFSVPGLVAWLVSDSVVEGIAIYFLQWRSLELLPLILFGVLRGYFSGIAHTRPILYANLLLSVVAIGLNSLLVLRYGWGLRGVVVSSILAQYVATGYLFYALRYQPYRLRPLRETAWSKPLLRYAGPAILQNLIGMIGWFVFFLVIERRGAWALASANIVRTLYSFSMLPTWAYATAAGTIVGYFWAAREALSLRIGFWKAIKISFFTNLAITIGLLFSSPWIVPLFTTDPVIEMQARRDLYMIAVSLLLMPPSAILVSAVVAVGKAMQVFWVEVIIISLYLAYTLIISEIFQASVTILWSADWVYWIPSAVILGWIFYRRLREMKESSAALPELIG